MTSLTCIFLSKDRLLKFVGANPSQGLLAENADGASDVNSTDTTKKSSMEIDRRGRSEAVISFSKNLPN
jgi:hypothetical protein